MNITYQRKVIHCEPSPYIREVTIDEIGPAKNSDFLERITFKEIGWTLIGQKGLYESGQVVYFIPAESILPNELAEEIGVTKYLAKGKVRVARLRGNRSEGLIIPKEKIEPYLPYILKWEDPPTTQMRGYALPIADRSPDFEKFYKMPNLLNEPDTFKEGESVFFSEKIHGTNVRCGLLKHPQTEEYQVYAGSHNVVLQQDENNLYWITVLKVADKLPKGYVLFAEIFGSGIQHLHYDRGEPDILFFNAMYHGEYLKPRSFMRLCEEWDLPRVKMHKTVYSGIDTARMWADLESEYTNTHLREGIVIVSADRPGVMGKVIGFNYLASKDKKKTERR